jgi:iron complex transport system ATP-binding protein
MTLEEGILIETVSLSYSGRPVLDKISLRMQAGKVTTLLGPNGCGKTSLLKILNGLIRPTEGNVCVNGHGVSKTSSSSLARMIGYVPQGHRSSFPFSCMEIVLTGRMPHLSAFSDPGTKDLQIALQSLSLVGADHLADRPYTQISGGERQLVMIARAMAQEPSILLLDEPTSYLDFRNQILTLRMIAGIALRKGVTVIMTLHDPNHALMFSDQVVLLRKLAWPIEEGSMNPKLGNVVASGKPSQVLTPQNIRDAYGIDIEVITHKGRSLLLPI